MKLFLVRHGETVDNVRGVYAGVTDSALTQHGVLQANRLGQHLAERGVKVTHVFSSDLQRAFKTAEATRQAQPESEVKPSETKKLVDLREQDFGFYEGKVFYERPKESNKSGKEEHRDGHHSDPGFKDVESKDAMKLRSDRFVDAHLLPLFESVDAESSVVVVAHGIILAHLWRCVLRRFPHRSVSILPGAIASGRDLVLEYLGGWSNTGYLELEIDQSTPASSSTPSSTQKRKREEEPITQLVDNAGSTVPLVQGPVNDLMPEPPLPLAVVESESTPLAVHPLQLLPDMKLVVKAVNCLEHLKGLRKTRGGIGSAKHDESQKTIQSFFKKRKTE